MESLDANVFWITMVVSLAAAALVVTRKNPIYGAVFIIAGEICRKKKTHWRCQEHERGQQDDRPHAYAPYPRSPSRIAHEPDVDVSVPVGGLSKRKASRKRSRAV